MAKILCTRQNASEEINGVAFTKTDEGMLSEEISDEQAAAFCKIPGYALIADGQAAARAAAQAKADAEAARAAAAGAELSKNTTNELEANELAALVAEATGLGIEVKGNWKAARLTAEIARAKSVAAGKSE